MKATAYGTTPSKRPANTHRKGTALKTVNIDLDRSARKKEPVQSEQRAKPRPTTSLAKKTTPFTTSDEIMVLTETHQVENKESITYSLPEQTITEVP